MDATFAALVGGFFSVILALGGAVAYLARQRDDDRIEARSMWAGLALKIEELKTRLDQEYLLREPHMQEHKMLQGRIDAHSRRILALENEMASRRKGTGDDRAL